MRTILITAGFSMMAVAADAQTGLKKTPIPGPPLELNLKSAANAKGDAALAWVSPLLDNHDSRISNKVWSIDGKQQHRRFAFSVVNLDPAAPLEVAINCYGADGKLKPKYSKTLTAPASGGADWNSFSIAPDRSSDQVTLDLDRVWCLLTADKPFAAFGQRNEGSISNPALGALPVIMVAVAR